MKYLKTYKIFEAEIERTFDEWLKDPKAAKKDPLTYQFEFPVKKVFNIDESNINIDRLAEYIEQEKDINIYQNIANEIDLRSGMEENDNIPSVSEEEVRANSNEYFKTWVQQQYNNDMSKFFRMYDLDFEELQLTEEDFEELKENFNHNPIQQIYPYREFNHDFQIRSIQVTKLKNNNKIVGDILISRELSQDEIDSIKDFLEGQCSDGWGEAYEQASQDKEEVNGLNFYVNIKTWWGDGYPEWYLDIK